MCATGALSKRSWRRPGTTPTTSISWRSAFASFTTIPFPLTGIASSRPGIWICWPTGFSLPNRLRASGSSMIATAGAFGVLLLGGRELAAADHLQAERREVVGADDVGDGGDARLAAVLAAAGRRARLLHGLALA